MSDNKTHQKANVEQERYRRDLMMLQDFPTSACDRLNSNLRLLETRLFMLAQHTQYRDIVFIDNPRSQIALQRMTAGEIEQLASASQSSFVLSQSPSILTSEVDMYSVRCNEISHILGGHLNEVETLVYDYLLTMRDLVVSSPSVSASCVRTGLDTDSIDDLESLSFDVLRRLSRLIVAHRPNETPLFQLRYDSKLLTAAAKDPARFSQMRLAQTISVRHW